jgi:hypothetical protein
MTAVTARVAGVKTVVVASPRPALATLAAAYLSDADYFLATVGAGDRRHGVRRRRRPAVRHYRRPWQQVRPTFVRLRLTLTDDPLFLLRLGG